jgi:tyrosine-protein kinase Etk/Wzc
VNEPNLHTSSTISPSNKAPLIQTHDHDGVEINFREIVDIIWSGKWLIFFITLLGFLVSLTYVLIAPPIYQANGLVQVEQQKNSGSSSIDQLSSLIGTTSGEAPAEIAILESRMVLQAVADGLKLNIQVQPKYFPFLGRAIAHAHTNSSKPARVPLLLRSYAWGGERIRITELDFPLALHDTPFYLVAKSGGTFDLKTLDGDLVLSGAAGERSSVNSPQGPIAIFVQELVAEPGTTFVVTRLAIQTLLSDLAEKISVSEQPRDSGILSLQVQDYDSSFAAQLVNEVEDAYLSQNIERRASQAKQSLEFLKQQLPELRAKVDEAQARLNSYQMKKGSVDVQQETELILKQTVDLETQRLTAVQARDAALQRYTDQHPVVATLSEQIRGLEREQANLKKQVAALPETQQEILSLMRDLEVNTQLYTALLNSAQELQITKAGTIGNVRIIDRGLAPLIPVKPNKKMVLAIGTILGGFLGIVSIFALRALLRGVDRPEEVERVIGLPTYASIPYSRAQQTILGRKGAIRAGKLLATVDPEDLAIEALRSLRTSLHFAMMEASNNVVMFTGPVAALGKSFITINLGAVLAMSGKRVIVIDADMRRGGLHRYAGTEQKPGLSDHIAGTAEISAIVCKTSVPELDFVPNGTRPPNPSEILMSERFANLLSMLSKQYDYVLIDTPPVLPVTDAAIVGCLAGTTLVVLKAAEHPMRAIEETVKRLRQSGVQVRGVVFNQVGARVGSYGYGAYGYAYGYSSYGYKNRD